MKTRKLILLTSLLFVFIFTACTSKEDKEIIATVETALKAAADNNMDEFAKVAPFILEYEELPQSILVYAFAQFNEKKKTVSVIGKNSDTDIRVKITFISDFEPITIICYKEGDRYFLTDSIIETQEYDYIEAE